MKKENLRQEKGITLIALVITIIVMLILVGVTITLAVNGGLFDYAKHAATETNKAKEYESGLANVEANLTYQGLIDKYTTGTQSTGTTEPVITANPGGPGATVTVSDLSTAEKAAAKSSYEEFIAAGRDVDSYSLDDDEMVNSYVFKKVAITNNEETEVIFDVTSIVEGGTLMPYCDVQDNNGWRFTDEPRNTFNRKKW